MVGFLKLPVELLFEIGELIDVNDRKSLRVACKDLSECFEACVLHTVSIDISTPSRQAGIAKLSGLALGKAPGLTRSARHLIIKSLAARRSDDPVVYNSEGAYGPDSYTQAEIDRADNAMKEHLRPALVSFESVSKVTWTMRYLDREWSQNIAIKALQTLPNLRTLVLAATSAYITLPLHEFPYLQHVELSDNSTRLTPNSKKGRTFKNLARLIATAPDLTYVLAMRGGYGRETRGLRPTSSLHQYFSECSPENPRHIQRLFITGMFVKIDPITQPHLRHLVALELSHIREPYNPPPKRHSAIFQYLPELMKHLNGSYLDGKIAIQQREVGSSLEEIWTAISAMGLRLEEVIVSRICPAFLRYLESYSGVKKLVLKWISAETPSQSDGFAKSLFGVPLQRHVDTLEDFRVSTQYEGLWCFGPHNAPVISRMKSLKRLEIPIASYMFTEYLVDDIVINLLDTMVAHFPGLERLTLHAASPASMHNTKPDRDPEHLTNTYKNIRTRVRTFEEHRAHTANRMPEIFVGKKRFRPVYEGVKGWHFRESDIPLEMY
ncbi:unnamed protein product [Cyclocybe aegerita]|uniref:F-box domain-containing protein n=1 Tax=Cyclocybe aegerita TaxID=1973307 RepID=A0A8S0W8E1_CYCAE|nr:unnamed protein product [Cyclocybe aegerita]